jgi:hypothetical protein
MADDQPTAAPQEQQPMLERSFLSDVANDAITGAAAGTATYALVKGEQIVSKVKDAVGPKKQ